jgi:F-type H+-transporting ATPase subunit b
MKEIMRTMGKSALVALVLWFALAAGSVWANTHGEAAATGEGMPTADAHMATEMHGEEDAGHAIVEGHTAEAAALHGEAEGTHGGHAVVDSLSPAKVKDFWFRVMNFAVLMIILVKFGAKPIANALGDRRKQIRVELEDLEAKKVAAEKAYKEFSAKLEAVEKDVSTIVEKAVAQAEIEKVRILEAAEKSADDVKRSAEMAISNEVTAAKRTLKIEVTEQAAVMAEELIIKNLTADDQVKIIEDYLDKVGAVQ